MNNKEKIHISNLINKEIRELKKRIPILINDTKPIEPENSIGRISRMDAINNKSVLVAALNTAKKKLKNLLVIKEKINNNDFGLCVKCKNKIPIQRLIIIPESRKCVNCSY